MKLAESRLTRQGQISVPAEVRRRLGLAPGSVLQWDVEDDRIVVRRASGSTFADIHEVLCPTKPARKSLDELQEGIRRRMRKRHARR